MTFVESFRRSAPYVHTHRGGTFVITFGGEAVESPGFPELIHDVALLHALGVRIVLVHGARPQIEARLAERGVNPHDLGDRRVTDELAMACVKAAVGAARVDIEAILSTGVANSPMAGARIRVAAGNFVTARPIGIIDGVDHQHTGVVRRIDADAVRQRLDDGAVALLSPLGYSITGETFNVGAHDVAAAAAAALEADKLISLVEGPGAVDAHGNLLRQLTPDEARAVLDHTPDGDVRRSLNAAIRACGTGVRRAHLIDRRVDGGLLHELFTRDGIGTMVTSETFEGVRSARPADVKGLLALIRPLAAAGILLERPREVVEREIGRFTVIERDGLVIACAACHPYPDDRAAEIACVAVHPDYRDGGRGDVLLQYIERKALELGLTHLFTLTTRTAHWFRERGFAPGGLDNLPVARRATWTSARNSQVYVKTI